MDVSTCCVYWVSRQNESCCGNGRIASTLRVIEGSYPLTHTLIWRRVLGSCEPDEWHRARQYVAAGKVPVTYVPVTLFCRLLAPHSLQASCEATRNCYHFVKAFLYVTSTITNSNRLCSKFIRRFGQLFPFSKLSLVLDCRRIRYLEQQKHESKIFYLSLRLLKRPSSETLECS